MPAKKSKRKQVTTFIDARDHAALKVHLWVTKGTFEDFAREAIQLHMEKEKVRSIETLVNGPRKRRKKVAV